MRNIHPRVVKYQQVKALLTAKLSKYLDKCGFVFTGVYKKFPNITFLIIIERQVAQTNIKKYKGYIKTSDVFNLHSFNLTDSSRKELEEARNFKEIIEADTKVELFDTIQKIMKWMKFKEDTNSDIHFYSADSELMSDSAKLDLSEPEDTIQWNKFIKDNLPTAVKELLSIFLEVREEDYERIYSQLQDSDFMQALGEENINILDEEVDEIKTKKANGKFDDRGMRVKIIISNHRKRMKANYFLDDLILKGIPFSLNPEHKSFINYQAQLREDMQKDNLGDTPKEYFIQQYKVLEDLFAEKNIQEVLKNFPVRDMNVNNTIQKRELRNFIYSFPYPFLVKYKHLLENIYEKAYTEKELQELEEKDPLYSYELSFWRNSSDFDSLEQARIYVTSLQGLDRDITAILSKKRTYRDSSDFSYPTPIEAFFSKNALWEELERDYNEEISRLRRLSLEDTIDTDETFFEMNLGKEIKIIYKKKISLKKLAESFKKHSISQVIDELFSQIKEVRCHISRNDGWVAIPHTWL